MIYYSTPWSSKKNIGEYYNSFMKLLPSKNDFACFVDYDAMFTTNSYGKQIEDIVKEYPECGLFTATTNRLANEYQRAGIWNSDNINTHRKIGNDIQKKYYDVFLDISKAPPLGGVLILIRKNIWEKLGGFNTKGMLGVDNDIHNRAKQHNENVYLMKGIYLYHWYRGGNQQYTKHLL